MSEDDLVTALRDTFTIILKLGCGPLLAMLAAGLVVSLIQAVTSINEQSLSFVPKLIALLVVLMLGEHFLASSLTDYTLATYAKIVTAGG